MFSKKQLYIQHFFSKPTVTADSYNIIQNNMLEECISTKRSIFYNNNFSQSDISSPKKVGLDFTNPYLSLTHRNYDLSFLCNKLLLQNQLIGILNKIWAPEMNYKFPIKSITSGKKEKDIKS
jgi:hypothetical protein